MNNWNKLFLTSACIPATTNVLIFWQSIVPPWLLIIIFLLAVFIIYDAAQDMWRNG